MMTAIAVAIWDGTAWVRARRSSTDWWLWRRSPRRSYPACGLETVRPGSQVHCLHCRDGYE